MATVFALGEGYTRPEIRALVGDPNQKGGAWDTGYRRWRGEFFIFAGVGIPGRTGHNYDNHWKGETLVWQARNNTKLRDRQIQELLSGAYPIHLFTREDERLSWTYRGLATPLTIMDTSPVGVVWAFGVPSTDHVERVNIEPTADEADPVTETEAVRAARLGQSKFRQDLMDLWDRQCAVTGLALPELLRASHIKPWRHSSPQERLDPDNGLLLAVHVDGLFDRGLISFDDDGAILRSPMLSSELMRRLGLDDLPPIKNLNVKTRAYLAIHREQYLKREVDQRIQPISQTAR
ncbi:HNH endonuclease [Phenylobacterium montanum]|uniref:HNH endonuclease n=1 Tax=Phenylobacterium montanum TaxID=2823693 RepID=A0A975IT30_9CAUL|nr:HNH endonuclease [Caulobacter sp. S6]QUD86054.1 HNH endonuclease [Caulobacter sp. S6]